MNIYLITLEGQGDIYIKPVDEETFNWVTSNDEGRPAGAENESGWEDQLVPASQRTKMEAAGDWPVEITLGSYDNDRALFAHPSGDYDTYYTLKEAFKAIRQHGDEVVDEYHGYIY